MNPIAAKSAAAIKCISCESTAIQTTWVDDQIIYGEGEGRKEISVRVPLRHCISCGSSYMDEEAEELRHSAVCEHLRILSPKEITSLRQKYRMSQQELADLSRLGRASLARWETGALFQNPANDNLLFLLSFPENVERLKRRGTRVEISESREQVGRKFRALNPTKLSIAKKESQSFQLHTREQ